MKLVTFSHDGEQRIGIVENDTIIDIHAILTSSNSLQRNEEELIPTNMKDLLTKGPDYLDKTYALIKDYKNRKEQYNVSKIEHKLDEVKVEAPIQNPSKLICVGLNYFDHCKEAGMEVPRSPVIFSKYNNAIISTNEAIILPSNTDQVDYEAELAFVIGEKAKNVNIKEAMNYVAGYTIMNDVSARDMQFGDGQWTRGKTADTFAPIGPVLVTKDEIDDPHTLDIKLFLNGEVMQDSNTKNLIHDIPSIISYLSVSMTLEPGDIIATGTPPGVGMGREPKVWLKPGDEVVIEVEKIGQLRNWVK